MAFRVKAAAAPAAPAPSASAAAQHHAKLERGTVLRAKLDAVTQEELNWPGEKLSAEVVMLQTAKRDAAEALAETGEFPKSSKRRTFSDLIAERRIIEQAILINNEECERLRLKAAGERYSENLEAVTSVGRRMALAIIELEAAMIERDRLARFIAMPPGSLWSEGWPLGRVISTGSLQYRFLEQALLHGAITQAEFDKAINAARAANP